MKKRTLCLLLILIIIMLCGCLYIIVDAFEEFWYRPVVTEMEVGEKYSDRDYFIEKLPCNYVYYVDPNFYMSLYKIPEDWVGEYDIYTKTPVMRDHYIFANYTDNAIAFCREGGTGTIRWIGFDFNTGASKFYDSLEEISSELGLDKEKWFKCCHSYNEFN